MRSAAAFFGSEQVASAARANSKQVSTIWEPSSAGCAQTARPTLERTTAISGARITAAHFACQNWLDQATLERPENAQARYLCAQIDILPFRVEAGRL